ADEHRPEAGTGDDSNFDQRPRWGRRGDGEHQGPGRGRGMGFGRGRHADASNPVDSHPHDHANDDRHQEDHDVFQFLLQNHGTITRKVTPLKNGVDTLTESSKPEVAEKIKEHVEWMKFRVEENHPIRMRDPLFAEIFQHTDKIEMTYTDTERGVRVIETSDDPYVAKLIQAHAEAVSGFVERGFAEAMKNHAVPRNNAEHKHAALTPAIADYGSVVQLPSAVSQPRSGTQICVDVTSSGSPLELNPALERVARYLNIYRAAGAAPADVKMLVVLHGKATTNVLHDDAYAKKFPTADSNPNFDCLHQLHEAGVSIQVCGQSLASQNMSSDDVMLFTDVAVSALTAVVNAQSDGFAIIKID
ncbi:MAG: DsrE family protein, partial [Rubripirellula sp.]